MRIDRTASKLTTIEELGALASGFTGTEDRYRHAFGQVAYTDGIQTIAEAFGAYWLIDIIASYAPAVRRCHPRVWEFGIARLHVVENPLTGRSSRTARFDWREDTNTAPVVSQDIEYTDFPIGVFECYVESGVILLKSEH